MRILIFLLTLLLTTQVSSARGEELIGEIPEDLSRQLESSGLPGRIHGVNTDTFVYIFTWRDPEDFFHFYNFPLIPQSPDQVETLNRLTRHQAVTVRGRFLQMHPPQRHILVDELIPGKAFTPVAEAARAYKRDVPDFLRSDSPPNETCLRRLHGIIHAVALPGRLFVLQVRDAVLPVIAPEGTTLPELWRGDKVEVKVHVGAWPPKPKHLRLALVEEPVIVRDAIRELDGRELTLRGELVLFADSPVLNRDIWAIRQTDERGLSRFFTLFNFDEPEKQDAVDKKLRTWWEAEQAHKRAGRNKWVNPAIHIQVRGRAQVMAINQANPALNLSAEDITLLPRPESSASSAPPTTESPPECPDRP